jgi:hypothetical protein
VLASREGKGVRAMVFGDVIRCWQSASILDRDQRQAFVLVIAVVWAMNALQARPKDWRAERYLAKAVLPAVMNEDGIWETQNNRGLHFFAGLRYGSDMPVPRFPNAMEFEITILQNMVGDSPQLISLGRHLCGTTSAHKRVAVQLIGSEDEDEEEVEMVLMKKRRSNKMPTGLVDGTEVPVIFDLEAAGHKLINLTAANGLSSDEDEDDEDTEHDRREHGRSLDREVSVMVAQLLSDIVQKVPASNRHGPSYLRPNAMEQMKADPRACMERKQLKTMFAVAALRPSFADTSFLHFLPEEGQVKGQWTQMQYWKDYVWLREHTSASTMRAVRAAVKKNLKKLAWFPLTEKDKAWVTRLNSRTVHTELYGVQDGAAPILVTFNGRSSWS